uniref:microtubule organization protein AKNA isoform X2 n=1 Tax=Scatophagus argus TaxID=75038 RepID=UPI001ED82F8B|nr:microtubule organization protein AKNA isoform X2 [Scatophagus argus]
MEARKSTTAGVVFWTPAPVRTSPTSSVESEDEWEDDDEEQAERDDDFLMQMDENGIIGLSEALEDVELVETYGDTDAECNSNLYCRSLNPEKADTLEQLSYDLSEHLSHTESRGDDVEILPPCDNFTGSRKAGEKVRQSKEKQGMGCLPGRDKYLDMTEEGKDGGEAGKTSNRKKNKTERSSTARELITTNGSSKSCISKGETWLKSSVPSCSAHLLAMEPAGVSSHHCPVSQPASPVTSPTHPHLLHFTPEEVAAAPWIEAETLPEMSFTESLSESQMIHLNLRSSPRCPEIEIRASPQPAAMFSEEVVSNHYNGLNNGRSEGWQKSNKHHKQPTPSARKMRHLSPEDACSSRSLSIVGVDLKCKHQTTSSDRVLKTPRTKSNAAAVDESRKRTLSYRTPDFSKVEPRVRIPKSGYKPPKSKRSSTRESLSPEPPLVFKSPADIVKEVLLNMPDGPSAPSDSDGPAAGAPDFTVPRDFRCRRQATTLLEQLQEDYNTLLTKYAEAENTIDRLRLEAKVNLYSDPAKPSHMVQSGLNQEASRLMTLDFPQAQRVEISSASCHPDGLSANQRSSSAGPSTRSPDPHEGQQPAKILYNQADKFLQQLQNFEELQKNGKLRRFDQVKGLSQLAEGLESLERGYLLARDEHKLLLQRGAEIGHFDPERELEGLIFQCGLLMDELKEQVEQMTHEQATCEAPPSAPPHPTPPSVPCEGGESLTHPQDPPVPLPVEPGVVAEVSPASEESYEAMEDEETLYLRTLNGKHRCADLDFATPTDHYQSFKELPKLLVHSQRDGAPLPAALRIDVQPGEEETTRQSQRGGNQEVQKSVPQRKSDHEDSPPLRTSKQQTSRSSPPSHRASSKSTTLPTDPPSSSRRRFKVGKSCSSSLSSLGDVTALERRNSKVQSGRSRVLSQDGIISPETDSGFVGSESSRLTPAAAPSPLHQRASESVSVPEEGKPRQPQTGLTSAPSPACSPSHCCPAAEPTRGSRLSLDQPRRSRQGQRRCTLSSSPQRWVSQTEQGRADSGTSDFGLESVSTHTVSEDRQNGRYTESISSFSSSSLSSSPTARHHRGDSVRALSSSQVASPNDAVQTLQAEVTRLKEKIESYFRNKEHPSSVRATPSAQENCTQPSSSTPCIRSGERWSNDSRGRRDVDESTPRRTTLKKPPSAHRQKPQANLLTAPEPSTPQPQPQVSRFTQTSAAAPDGCPHSNTVHSRTHPRQRSGESPQACDTADEPDSRSRQVPLCPQCLSRHQGRPERPAGGHRELTHSCHRCPLCGCPEPYRSTEPDCRRVSHSSTHSNRQPAESPDGAARSRLYAAADPPALLQCMPVCPPPFLNSAGSSSGVRGRGEASGRTRRSRSADKQRSLDSSLNRAIRAARHMKLTSGHMACSLASGLHYQELLTHSCSY